MPKHNLSEDELAELTKFARQTHKNAAKFGHDMLWHFRGVVAIGRCKHCNQSVEVGLDDNKDELTSIGRPNKCRQLGLTNQQLSATLKHE